MTGAFSLAGWHFSRNPTSSSSENKVAQAVDSEPWKTGGDAKYQYHPGGDMSKGKRDAPSALNEVIIPNVNLPKVSQDPTNLVKALLGWESYMRSRGYGWLMCVAVIAREVQQVG